MTPFVTILVLSFIGSILGLLGGIILLLNENLAKKSSLHLISFAAGVILAATFLDILPEAIEKGGEGAFLLMLLGLVGFFLVEDFLLHFHHHEEHEHSLKTVVPLVITSDAVHNFVDGIVIATSFLTDTKLGWIIAFATFCHEIPQEIGDFAVLLSAGVSKTKVLTANLLTALTTFAGAILAYFTLGKSHNLMGPLLGLATGMFLYIASADILPELVRGKDQSSRWHTAGYFLSGITLIYIITKFLPG